MIHDKKILVTGGAGSIGSVLVKTLAPYNLVVVFDNLSSGHEENVGHLKYVKFYKGSVLDDEVLKELFTTYSFDYVFHLAANFANRNSVLYPQRDLEVNGMGTLKLLQYARDFNIKCFVYTSSSCVYGNHLDAMHESATKFDLHTPYAITKMLGERYVEFYNRFHGLRTVTVRVFNSYGPGEYPGEFRNVIINFFWSAMKGRPITITGTGQETRDFTFNADIVRGMLLATENEEVNGEVFNLGSGREVKIIDLARRIIGLTGARSEIVFAEQREWDATLRRKANIDKAREMLGYTPQWSLYRGLKATWAWVQEVKESPLWPLD